MTLPPLLVVTDRHATRGRPLEKVVEAALEGGARLVQLREKDLDARALCELARSLALLCDRRGARLLVNERVDIALAAGAGGVVLPADSFSVADARALLDAEAGASAARMIGLSTHSADEVRRASAEGADFAIFGPVFATPSKARFGEPQGLERLAEAVAAARVPVYAIGGIDETNAASARARGAVGVAVIRAVMAAADPAAAVRGLSISRAPR